MYNDVHINALLAVWSDSRCYKWESPYFVQLLWLSLLMHDNALLLMLRHPWLVPWFIVCAFVVVLIVYLNSCLSACMLVYIYVSVFMSFSVFFFFSPPPLLFSLFLHLFPLFVIMRIIRKCSRDLERERDSSLYSSIIVSITHTSRFISLPFAVEVQILQSRCMYIPPYLWPPS